MTAPLSRFQRGAAAVEFAIVAPVFFVLLLGAIEMGRLLWTWNAAAEATRLGARIAVVCPVGAPAIKARMSERLPALTSKNITVTYLNPPHGENTCDTSNCKAVRVALSGYSHQPIIPLSLLVPGAPSLDISIPPFQTTLPREFMNSTGNPVCN